MMSPKVLEAEGLIFWFHSSDALHETRAGKTLRTQELNKALKVIEQDLEYLLEEWHGYRNKANN
jgi:hypothetical protein